MALSSAPSRFVFVAPFLALTFACNDPVSPSSGLSGPPPAALTVEPTPDANPPVEAEPVLAAGSEKAAAEGDEKIEADPQANTEAAAPGAQPTQEAKAGDEAAAPSGPQKILILGDSLAATGFGVVLQKELDKHPQLRCYRKAKSATGLARPDYFDWMREAKRQVELREPDLVVVIMGGNDGQDLTPVKRKKGARVKWKSEQWGAGYRKRMDALLAELTKTGAEVLWLSLPQTQTTKFEAKLEIIRAVQQEAVAALGDRGTYLETTALLSDDSGTLRRVVPGRKDRLRADDGIHFTMAGSKYFAAQVYPEVLNALELPDVQEK